MKYSAGIFYIGIQYSVGNDYEGKCYSGIL